MRTLTRTSSTRRQHDKSMAEGSVDSTVAPRVSKLKSLYLNRRSRRIASSESKCICPYGVATRMSICHARRRTCDRDSGRRPAFRQDERGALDGADSTRGGGERGPDAPRGRERLVGGFARDHALPRRDAIRAVFEARDGPAHV